MSKTTNRPQGPFRIVSFEEDAPNNGVVVESLTLSDAVAAARERPGTSLVDATGSFVTVYPRRKKESV